MDDSTSPIEVIFAEAVCQPSASQRAMYLAAACRGEDRLRGRVEALLKAHDNAGSFLVSAEDAGETATLAGKPANADSGRPPAVDVRGSPGKAEFIEQPGAFIGRYRLLQQIGEGGFGVVYMAEQEKPVKRRVALKVIKAGMDTKTVIARFEAERQALAMMDHPNIARVFDAGATETGRPYFVMELVKGIPITEYCDQANLDMRHRLELFMDVCRAVQHAHQKGVIHRDLKPSNIMITLHDGKAVVKVIDFGIAKATDQKLTEKTLFTNYGQMIGTPAYMSPEQAVMSGLDVDTRSDVYSLGVLLYELLTGSPPFAANTLRSAGFDEMRRIIREEEPQKPSIRLSTLAQDAKLTVATQRQVSPQVLSRQLHGDLDWIILKAIEKDRARRYESASAFAQDIDRHLKSEPVTAAAPSASYKLRKFVRRNKAQVAAVAAIALLLLAGTAVSTWQAIIATRAKHEAMAAALEEGKALDAAHIANEQSQKRLNQIEKANGILGSIFRNLDPKEIAKAKRPLQAILVEKLDSAAEQLEGDSIGDPLVVATMQNTFGMSLLGLGEPNKALGLLEKARATRLATLGLNHPDTLTSMFNLAWAYQAAGKMDLAIALDEETLKLRRAVLGPRHADTLSSMNDLAVSYHGAGRMDLALPLYEETFKLDVATLGPDHMDTLTTMNNLALMYQDVGKLDLALPLFEEALRRREATLGSDHPDTLISMDCLGSAYRLAGKLDLALPLLERALKLSTAKLGPDHSETLDWMSNLAGAYEDAGKLDLALALNEQSLKRSTASLGPDHFKTLTSMNNLARTYRAAGKLDLAVPLFEEAVTRSTASRGRDHPETLAFMNNLAEAYLAAGRLDLALPLCQEALKLTTAKLGPDHPQTLKSMNDLADAYGIAGKMDLAVPLFEEAVKRSTAARGRDNRDTLAIMGNLAQSYLDAGKLDLALPLFEEAVKLSTAARGRDNPDSLFFMNNLAATYQAAGKPELALPLFEETLKLRKAKFGPDHPGTLDSMNILGVAYNAAGKLDLALALFEETLKLRKAKLGTDHPDTLQSMHNLAAEYLAIGKQDAALALFEETLKLQKIKLGPDHAATLSTMECLGWTYADAGKLDLAQATYEEWLKLKSAKPDMPDTPDTLNSMAHVGLALLKGKAFAAAEPLLRECVTGRQKIMADEWRTFNAQSMLGGALLGQKKYADAEPLLLSGYEGMKQREKQMNAESKIRLTEALDRLIGLYKVRGEDGDVEKAEKYRNLRDAPRGALTQPENITR